MGSGPDWSVSPLLEYSCRGGTKPHDDDNGDDDGDYSANNKDEEGPLVVSPLHLQGGRSRKRSFSFHYASKSG